MFKYSESASYERGDFVLFDGGLYICIAKNPTDTDRLTVTGKIPSEDHENYSIYPGERISTASEYFDYVTGDGQFPDKYLSTISLRTILQSYTFGITETGLSMEGIKDNGEYSTGLRNISTGNKIDGIVSIPSMNSGIFRISRNLQEVQDIFGSNLSKSKEDDPGFVVLRQYTFKNNREDTFQRTRVQEITDPIDGTSYIRFVQGRLDEHGTVNEVTKDPVWNYSVYEGTSEWKSVFISGAPKSKLESIRRYYTQRIQSLENKLATKSGNFYNEILKSFPGRGVTETQVVTDSKTVIVNLSTSKGNSGREIVKTVSVPIFTQDLGSEQVSIGISESSYINASISGGNTIILSVLNSGSESFWIKEIISRKYPN